MKYCYYRAYTELPFKSNPNISIAPSARLTANSPEFKSSALTLGPTFSTLLKLTSDCNLFITLSLIFLILSLLSKDFQI